MSRLLALLLTVLALTASRAAEAFHAGSVFGDPPGKGGTGRIYYTGGPGERGWTCTMCHVDPPGLIKMHLDVEPAELFETFQYAPGQSYDFTATLVGEHLGFSAGQSNFNGMALTVTDDAGIYSGKLGGFDANEIWSPGGDDAALVSSVKKAGVDSWSFTWTAPPEPGRGRATMFFGVVDGNGANTTPGQTRSDPFGDDVFMVAVQLDEEGAAATTSSGAEDAAACSAVRPRPEVPGRRLPPATPMVAAAAALLVLRRLASRTSRRSSRPAKEGLR